MFEFVTQRFLDWNVFECCSCRSCPESTPNVRGVSIIKPGRISCYTSEAAEAEEEEIYKLQNELFEARSSFKVESSEWRMKIKVVTLMRFLSLTYINIFSDFKTFKIGFLLFVQKEMEWKLVMVLSIIIHTVVCIETLLKESSPLLIYPKIINSQA